MFRTLDLFEQFFIFLDIGNCIDGWSLDELFEYMVDIKIIDLAVVTQTFLSKVIDHLTPSEIITVDGLIFLSSNPKTPKPLG